MVDLKAVEWRKDLLTKRYIEENADVLEDCGKMTPEQLVDACTYCSSIDNPYAYELLDRARMFEKFRLADDYSKAAEILRKAASFFGITLI